MRIRPCGVQGRTAPYRGDFRPASRPVAAGSFGPVGVHAADAAWVQHAPPGPAEKGTTMRVRDWMSPDPVATTPHVPAAVAEAQMERYGIRHLPVVRHGRVIGMISDRDVRSRRAADADVADIMSTPPHVIAADDTVEAAARMMLSRHINALPVVDVEGTLLGMITTTDCLLASLSPAAAG